MRAQRLHGWQLSPAQARELQRRLAAQVSSKSEISAPGFIAGVDIATGKAAEMATAAIVVLSYPELRVVETQVARGRLTFPYIPGLLSFRESSLTLAAAEKLSITPDLILVDGQGLAHPRRFGLASHLGLLWDKPTIGCAKSLLCGRHETPGMAPGSYAETIDSGETIGVALRTKPGANPVYVSIGHKVDLESAVHWVLECCRGYRLPEPLRLAHQVATGSVTRDKKVLAVESDWQSRLFDLGTRR